MPAAVRRILLVGGAGDMAAVTVRQLLAARPDMSVVLADRDGEKAARRAATLGAGRAAATAIDVFDAAALRDAVRGVDLVVNATGPLYRTVAPVLAACAAERTPYLDFGDDLEAAELALALDPVVRAAGTVALIGAGVAPGAVNVAVRALAAQLEQPSRVQVAWVTGPTPPTPGEPPGGRAVIEHMLHSCTGVTTTLEAGRRRTIPAFRREDVVDFGPPLGPHRVHDIGHAEQATLPRAFPTVHTVRTQGGLHPAPLNALFQAAGQLVARGALDWDEVVDALVGVTPRIPLRLLAAALGAVGRDTLLGRVGPRDLRALAAVLRRDATGSTGGLYVRVDGTRDGQPVALVARSAAVQRRGESGMDDVTGGSAAVFADLLLDGRVAGPGVVAPEQAVLPADFVASARRLGLAMLLGLFETGARITT